MKTRRDFLLTIPLFLLACTKQKETLPVQAPSDPYAIDKHLISEGHPIAKSFQYVKDATTASATIRKMRTGVDGPSQFCSNCQYYAAIGDDYGSCQMLPQGNVTAIGWCFSWAKKMATAQEVEQQYQQQ